MRWQLLIWTSLVSGLITVTAHAEPADDQYLSAATYYSQGHWSQAREAFQAFLTAHGTHPQADQARFYLGETLIQLRDYTNAADYFHQILARRLGDSLARKALYRAGEASYFAQRFDVAVQDLTKFLNQYPSDKLNAYVLGYLGDISLELSDLAKAEAYYTEGLERFPDGALNGDCRLGLAQVWEKQGKLADARKLYADTAARNDSWSDDAQLRLAGSYLQQKDYAVATAAYKAFLEKFAASASTDYARIGLGQALYHQQQDTQAEQVLKSIKSNTAPANDALYWLGMIQLRRQSWNEAAESLAAAASANPKHPLHATMLFLAGDALVNAERLSDAAPLLAQAIKAAPQADFADRCLLDQLRCAVAASDQSTVLDFAAEFGRRFPDHAQGTTVTLHQARALFALGRPAEVVPLLEPMIAILADPAKNTGAAKTDRLTGCYLLALAYQSQKRSDDVLSTLKPLLVANEPALQETRQEAWRLQAAVLVAQTKYADAITSLTNYLRQPAKDGEAAARAQLAICYAQTKNNSLAKEAYEAFLASKPADDLRKITTEALAEVALTGGEEAWAAELVERLSKQGGAVDPSLALYQSAKLSEQQGKHEQAATAYEKLVAQPPKGIDPDVLVYNAAWAWKQAEKPQQARALFERLHRDYASSRYWADATFRLAETAAEARQVPEAKRLLDELLQRQRSGDIVAHALYLQGQLAMAAENWTDVTAPLIRLVEQYPEHSLRPLAEFWLAESSYRQQNYDDALARFTKLSTRSPDDASQSWQGMIPLRRVQILTLQKKYDEARPIAAQIEVVYPNFEQQYEVDLVLGRCRSAAGEFAEAREAYQRVIRSPRGGRTESAAMAQWMLAETYFHQRDYEAALKEYLRVETVYPYPTWQALALLQAGKCHERLAQWAQAAEVYARLIKNHPGSTPVDEASQRLQAARQNVTRK